MSNHHKFTNSTSLTHCDYHEDKSILEICFSSGATYHYSGVSKSEYEALKAAASAGSHFQSRIRPKFKGVKQLANEI